MFEHLQDVLVTEFGSKPQLSMAEIKALLDLPRSAIIPLVEYSDRIGFTRRNGDYRELVHTPKIAPSYSRSVKVILVPEQDKHCPITTDNSLYKYS